MAKDDPDMRGNRSRNKTDGRMRKKRDDAHVGNIEKQYDVDFGVRDDMHLGTLLQQQGANSLSDLLHRNEQEDNK